MDVCVLFSQGRGNILKPVSESRLAVQWPFFIDRDLPGGILRLVCTEASTALAAKDNGSAGTSCVAEFSQRSFFPATHRKSAGEGEGVRANGTQNFKSKLNLSSLAGGDNSGKTSNSLPSNRSHRFRWLAPRNSITLIGLLNSANSYSRSLTNFTPLFTISLALTGKRKARLLSDYQDTTRVGKYTVDKLSNHSSRNLLDVSSTKDSDVASPEFFVLPEIKAPMSTLRKRSLLLLAARPGRAIRVVSLSELHSTFDETRNANHLSEAPRAVTASSQSFKSGQNRGARKDRPATAAGYLCIFSTVPVRKSFWQWTPTRDRMIDSLRKKGLLKTGLPPDYIMRSRGYLLLTPKRNRPLIGPASLFSPSPFARNVANPSTSVLASGSNPASDSVSDSKDPQFLQPLTIAGKLCPDRAAMKLVVRGKQNLKLSVRMIEAEAFDTSASATSASATSASATSASVTNASATPSLKSCSVDFFVDMQSQSFADRVIDTLSGHSSVYVSKTIDSHELLPCYPHGLFDSSNDDVTVELLMHEKPIAGSPGSDVGARKGAGDRPKAGTNGALSIVGGNVHIKEAFDLDRDTDTGVNGLAGVERLGHEGENQANDNPLNFAPRRSGKLLNNCRVLSVASAEEMRDLHFLLSEATCTAMTDSDSPMDPIVGGVGGSAAGSTAHSLNYEGVLGERDDAKKGDGPRTRMDCVLSRSCRSKAKDESGGKGALHALYFLASVSFVTVSLALLQVTDLLRWRRESLKKKQWKSLPVRDAELELSASQNMSPLFEPVAHAASEERSEEISEERSGRQSEMSVTNPSPNALNLTDQNSCSRRSRSRCNSRCTSRSTSRSPSQVRLE